MAVKPLVEGIRDLLITAGLTAYIIDAPATGNVVSVVPYASDIYDDTPVGTQFFQIRIAAETFVQSETNAWTAYNALNNKQPSGVDRDVVGLIRTKQEPFYDGKSEDGTRYIHIFNIAVSAIRKE